MDYIQQLNAFELWLETNYLSGSSQLVWYKLFMLVNRCGWAEWITVDNRRLMALADIKSETTFISARDKLCNAGLIDYQKGKKGSPNRYKLIRLYTPKYEVNNNCTPKFGANTELIRSEYASQNGVNPTDINKLNETKLNQTRSKKERGAVAPAPLKSPLKFSPPCPEDVSAYCQERNNGIDGQAFCDFYQSKGWKVGSNPMKDWKAAVRTWEKRNQGGGRNNIQPYSKETRNERNNRLIAEQLAKEAEYDNTRVDAVIEYGSYELQQGL